MCLLWSIEVGKGKCDIEAYQHVCNSQLLMLELQKTYTNSLDSREVIELPCSHAFVKRSAKNAIGTHQIECVPTTKNCYTEAESMCDQCINA